MTSAQMIRTLEENGFNSLQARTLLEVWEITSEQRDEKLVSLLSKTFATKEDIARLEGRMSMIEQKLEGRIAALQEKFTGQMAALEQTVTGQMAALDLGVRTQLAEFKGEMLKWLFSLLIAQGVLVLGGVLFIVTKLT